MDTDLSAQIERYLLGKRCWVPAAELSEQFGVRERQLRGLNGAPGLCTMFAISLPHEGYKHVACATTAEWLHFKHQMRRHGINELIRVRELSSARARVTRTIKTPAVTFEKDTGQAVFAEICA
jgi:hypothetical protein